MEERLIQQCAGVIDRPDVQPVGILAEVDGFLEHVDSQSKLLAGVLKPSSDGSLLLMEKVHACPDLRLGQGVVHQGVQESLLLLFELGKLTTQISVECGDCLLLGCQHLAQLGIERVGEVDWQGERGVVVLDSTLDPRHGEMRQVAVATLSSAAEVVRMNFAVSTLRLGVDKPGVATRLVAAVTTEQALQIVVQLALSGSGR